MSKSPVKFSNPFKNPLKFVSQLALAPLTVPAATLATAGVYTANTAMESLGIKETKEAKEAREAQEAANAEQTARAEAYNSVVGDAGLDAISRQEIMNMFNSGADTTRIASYLQQARSGKGVFGVRAINQNQATVQAQNPGRAATLGGGGVF